MPRIHTLISLFILPLILNCCTIEKRTFNRGYHVSWNKSLHKSPGAELHDRSAKEEIKSISETEEVELIAGISSAEQTSWSVSDKALNIEPVESFELSSTQELVLAQNPSAAPDTVYIYPKFEPLGIASFATSISAYGTFFIALAFWEELIFVSFALVIIALILGLLSLTEYSRNKIFYKQNVFGVIGTILAALPFLFLVVALLDLW